MMRKFFDYRGLRNFSESKIWRNLNKPKQIEPEKIVNPGEALKMDFKPNKFDKIMLKWCGKYKNKESIPERISFDELENAKSRFRIRFANFMILGTILMCMYYIYEGKRRQREGDTINRRDWERKKKLREEDMNK